MSDTITVLKEITFNTTNKIIIAKITVANFSLGIKATKFILVMKGLKFYI